ncbi:MAG: ATP-binding protein [candidate division WOR-3 bacterium]|nr:ATP-binding protein [candidate division WOR-3 bacterium]
MNRFFGSFSSFLFLLLIFVILVPLIIIQFSVNRITIKNLREIIDQRLTHYARTFIDAFYDECERCEMEIYFAKRYLFKKGICDREELGSYFFSSERPFSRVSLLDSTGTSIVSLVSNPDQTYLMPLPYEEFRNLPPVDLSNIKNITDTLLIPLQLLPNRAGFIQRIILTLDKRQFLLADVNLHKLVKNSAEKTNFPVNSFLLVFDNHGKLLYNNADFLASEETRRIKGQQNQVVDYIAQNRTFRIQKFEIDSLSTICRNLEKVYFAIGIDYTAMLAGIKAGLSQGLLLTTCFGIIVGMLFLFTGFYLKNNTEKILSRTREMAVGEFEKEISIPFPLEFQEIARNINELSHKLKMLTEEKIKSAKLSAIGRFAAHMVHDLRNPVYGLSLLASELKKLTRKDDPLNRYFNEIVSGIERLGEIIEKIADHGRIYEPKKERVEIEKLIGDVAQEFKKSNPCRIDLQFGNAGFVMIDPAQWRRVFLNLFQNSYEAKKEDCQITIRVNPCQHSHSSVCIEISDKSGGIPENILYNIFEPFTTTKKKGLGLGLSFVKEIVEVHDGEIRVENNPGVGVKFIITVPSISQNEIKKVN